MEKMEGKSMKITLESTQSTYTDNRVTVSSGSDDLDIFEVAQSILRPALLAYGFAPESVNEILIGEI
jgi:hypothetical protein